MYRLKLVCLCTAALGLAVSASARLLDRPQYLQPSSRIVGLYDSGDTGGEGQRAILPNVAVALEKVGLSLVLHDIAQGLPGAEIMRDARGVVTAFKDIGMVNPAAYIGWAEQQLVAGKRFLILGNFGAYQNLETKVWTDYGELNRVFRRLGVAFGGNWTDQAAELEVVSSNPVVVNGVDLAASAHYQWVRVTDPAVVPHLLVRRVGVGGSESALVFSSPTGGMVLEQYLTNAKGEFLIDLPKILHAGLLAPAPQRSDRILAVTEPDYSFGRSMENNLSWLARYARLQVDFVSIADVRRLVREDLQPYGTVVFATDKASELPPAAARMVEAWVREDGGGLVVALPNFRSEWKAMLGVKTWEPTLREVVSVKYETGLFPGVDGMTVSDDPGPGEASEPIASVHPVELDKAARPLARAVGGPPVLWSVKHGRGRVLVRNDQALADKVYRGQLLQLVLMSQPAAAAPLVNAGVYFVDDCPQPMWNVVKEPIKGEYGLSDTDFYRDTWWPDMQQYAKDFGIKYTFVLIFSYDDATSTGFTADPFFSEVSKGVPEQITRDAMAQGHEIGLHGYNHQSLVTEKGYTSAGWPSREAMMDGLRLARTEWAKLFGPGNMPFTYIAPNNHIHRAGKEAVAAVFPETRVLATSYLDDGDVEGGEWDRDPDVPALMGMPRVSSEFYVGAHNNVPFHDGIMLAGLWTHFAHPDDVYDPERNGGMGWKTLRVKQREMFQHLRDSYPWLRSLTARDTFHDLVRYRTDPFERVVSSDAVVFKLGSSSNETRWAQLRVDPHRQVFGTETAVVRHSYPEHGLHILELTGPEARVTLGPPTL